MKVAILVREETMKRCTGRGCLNAFFQRRDAFGKYESEIELVTFSHTGGDIDRKIEMMIKYGVDVVHLSSCMRGKASNYEALAARLGEHFDVVGYTHGAEEGKERNTITIKRGREDVVTDIIIRGVAPADLESVTRIEAACFPVSEAATRQSLQARIAAFPESFLVAEADGKLIGFINGCITNSLVICDEFFQSTSHHQPTGENQTVFGLDVVPEYRKQGIAAKLMRRFIQVAKDAGRKRVILTCKDRLVPYYEKFGFVNNGISHSTHGGAEWFDMTLVL